MNGGTVSLATNIESDRNLNWKVVGTGDFDGNGISDLLWREVTQGINRIWLMNGATVVSRPRILDALDLNWGVVSPSTQYSPPPFERDVQRIPPRSR
jgi:hypothetical protein